MRQGAHGGRTRGAAIAALMLAFLVAPAFADAAGPQFEGGAAAQPFPPPRAGAPAGDPADCPPSGGAAVFSGDRAFSFEEPYVDQQQSGHYDLGDPYVDCNHDGRWDGNFIGGGSDTPRYYDQVADDVGARALVVSNGGRPAGVEGGGQGGRFYLYRGPPPPRAG